MKNVKVDLRHIQTPRGMHAYIAYLLNFPAGTGRNLDALHDRLTEIGEATRLTLVRPAVLEGEMEKLWPRLALMLEDAQQENELLEIVVDIAD